MYLFQTLYLCKVKKVLILAYDFPPYNSVGAIRPFMWAKYFKQYEIDPIVVTRQWSSITGTELDYITPGESKNLIKTENEFGTVLSAPYYPNLANKILLKKGKQKLIWLRKMSAAWNEVAQYFLPVGTKRSVYIAACEYLKTNQVDIIIATGDPFVLFHYASKLSKQFQTPWIADYRDPWSNYLEKKKGFLYYFSKFVEKKTLKNVTHITTVSEIISKKITLLIGDKPVTIISNGYDTELIQNAKKNDKSSSIFTIAHAGTIYDWHPLEIFLETLNQWVEKTSPTNWRCVFYGLNQTERLQQTLDKFHKLKPFVSHTPRIPNNEMLNELRSSHLLLMFNYYAYMGTKIFDYIGIERQILLCFEHDLDALKLKEKYYLFNEQDGTPQIQIDLVRQTNSGIIVKNSNHLLQLLPKLYTEFRDSGKIQCKTYDSGQFSRQAQTKKLAGIIHQIVSSKS